MNFKKHSMQTKLMAFFTITILVLFSTVGILFFKNTKLIINSSKENELLTLSRETSNKIERFLFERYGDIYAMAQSPLLKNKSIDKRLIMEYLDTVRTAYKTYDYIFITDNKGNIKIVSGNLNGDKIYKKWIDNVLHGQIYVSDFTNIGKDSSNVVYFAAPIKDDVGKVIGSVVERMNFSSINSIVKNVNPGKMGYVYIRNDAKVSKEFKNESLDNLKDQKSGIIFTNDNSTGYVTAYSLIPKYNTQNNVSALLIKEPVEQAYAVTSRLRDYTMALVLISVLVLFIFASLMSRFITSPIKRLVAKAQDIAGGNLVNDVNVETRDEIGSLAQSFNILLSNLKSMMQQLLNISGEAASLQEIRQYSEKLFDNVPSGIIALDSTGKITAFNSQASSITGIKIDYIINKSANNENFKSISSLINLLKDGLEKGAIYIKHIERIRNNLGDEIPVMINTSIQRDTSSNIIGIIGVFKSLDEIKNFEESIKRAKNLASLGELSAGMAHEIRNPLTSIKGYAQYVKGELTYNNELSADMTIIINEVDRLNDILDRFLSFARPKQPEFLMENINDVIEEIVTLIKLDVLSNDIQLQMDLGNLVQIPIDFDQIKQAILNIVLNSIQAMQNGGVLKIQTSQIKELDMVEVKISDTGVGIKTEDYDKIFEPFYTTRKKGTGLGLAISLRIIENHKGFIEVSSTPSVGTTFTIKMPVKAAKEGI